MSAPQFDESQQRALRAMESGKSVFLTGGAGSGKSELLKHFNRTTRRRVATLATTAAAAQLIGGVTMHGFFNIRDVTAPGNTRLSQTQKKKIKSFDTFIIEEVGMMRIDHLQAIRDTLFACAKGFGPAAGYQLIFAGDFAQLPPVLTEGETDYLESLYGEEALYAFQSPIWKGFDVCALTHIHRQKDDMSYARFLNDMRIGKTGDLEMINAKVAKRDRSAVSIVATNKMANEINMAEMAQIKAGVYRFQGETTGIVQDNDKRVAHDVLLKPGSRVIICANNPERGYYNGSSGILKAAKRDDDGKPVAVVTLDTGVDVEVVQNKWEIIAYEQSEYRGPFERKVTGSFSQVPLVPGYAITVHRSQGMSIDKAHIDPAGTFLSGQIYVSLSRVTSLDGLTLASPIEDKHIMHDPRVLEYHSEILSAPEVTLETSAKSAYRTQDDIRENLSDMEVRF